MSKINEILVGWGNLVKDAFNRLDHNTKEKAEERLNICHNCNIRLGSICDPTKVDVHVQTGNLLRGCGCNIAAKAMNPRSKCPLGKW